MEITPFYIALGLTLFAGLSTGIGSALALCAKHTNTKFLSVSLGFSAGVMIYVSFMELMPLAGTKLAHLGVSMGACVVVLSFFGGMLLIAVIDKLVPSFENPHEMHKVEELHERNCDSQYSRGNSDFCADLSCDQKQKKSVLLFVFIRNSGANRSANGVFFTEKLFE